MVRRTPDHPLFHGTPSTGACYVDDIAVDPEFHGQRVGSALLAAAAAMALAAAGSAAAGGGGLGARGDAEQQQVQGRAPDRSSPSRGSPVVALRLDVRAANRPAVGLYAHLGFEFGAIERSSRAGWGWDGGYCGRADAREVARHLPEHADVTSLGARVAAQAGRIPCGAP